MSVVLALAAMIFAVAPSASGAVDLTTSWGGMTDPDALTPGDPTGAAGVGHVVAAVNVSMAVYDRTGGLEVGPIRLDNLAPSTLPFFFDPKVVYDQYTDTYVLVWVGSKNGTKESEIYVVSIPDATATDTGTWCAREFIADQTPGNGPQYADYPGLGYDQDRIYVSANMYDFSSGGEGTQVLAFDKASLYDCLATPITTVFTTDDIRLPDGKKIWTLQPATTVGAVASPGYALATRYNCPKGKCQGDELVIGRFEGASFQAKKIKVDTFKVAIGTQRGAHVSQDKAYWDVGDLRFGSSFYDSDTNRLYAAHALKKNLKKSDDWPEAVSRWYEVVPGTPLGDTTIDRIGDVGTALKDTGWPVVATDADDNVWVNFSRASGAKNQKEYLGAWVAVIHPGESDPAEITRFAEGTSLYAPNSGPARWGDYNAINRDPVDGTLMWVVNQRAASLTAFQQMVAAVTDL